MVSVFFAAGALACVGSFYFGMRLGLDRKQTFVSPTRVSTAYDAVRATILSPADAYLWRAERDASRKA